MKPVTLLWAFSLLSCRVLLWIIRSSTNYKSSLFSLSLFNQSWLGRETPKQIGVSLILSVLWIKSQCVCIWIVPFCRLWWNCMGWSPLFYFILLNCLVHICLINHICLYWWNYMAEILKATYTIQTRAAHISQNISSSGWKFFRAINIAEITLVSNVSSLINDFHLISVCLQI